MGRKEKRREQRRDKREKVLAKWRFIVKYGVLGWGLTVGVLRQVVNVLFDGLPSGGEWPRFISDALFDIVLYLFFGAWWGWMMWGNDDEKKGDSEEKQG